MSCKPGTHPNMLLAILKDGKLHTLDELCKRLPCSREQVIRAATKLKDHNLMDRDTEIGQYRLSERGLIRVRAGFKINSGPARAHGKAFRQRDSFRVRAWKSMRVRIVFTVGDVLSDATRDEPDQSNNLLKFLGQLRRAGYVGEMPTKERGSKITSPGFKRFRLLKNTGVFAPVYRPRERTLMDFNTGEEVACR